MEGGVFPIGGRWQMMTWHRERREGRAKRLDPTEGRHPQRLAMESALQGNELAFAIGGAFRPLAVVLHRELDRRFDGSRAVVAEEDVFESLGGDAQERLGEHHCRLVGDTCQGGVTEPTRLLREGANQTRMIVSE